MSIEMTEPEVTRLSLPRGDDTYDTIVEFDTGHRWARNDGGGLPCVVNPDGTFNYRNLSNVSAKAQELSCHEAIAHLHLMLAEGYAEFDWPSIARIVKCNASPSLVDTEINVTGFKPEPVTNRAGQLDPRVTGMLARLPVDQAFKVLVSDVIELIRNHESCSGCEAGKREALEELNIDSDQLYEIQYYIVGFKVEPDSDDPESLLDNMHCDYDGMHDSYSLTISLDMNDYDLRRKLEAVRDRMS